MGADFCAPKSGYRPQKRPVLPPGYSDKTDSISFILRKIAVSPRERNKQPTKQKKTKTKIKQKLKQVLKKA